MSKLKFTPALIKGLPPKKNAYTKFENNTARGVGTLGLKVQPTGRKSFIFRYFIGDGRHTKQMTLGDTSMMSLAQARKEVQKLSLSVSQGLDPKAMLEEEFLAKKRQQEKELARKREEEQRGSLGQLLDYYIKTMKMEGKRSYDKVAHALETDVLSVLSSDVKARDVSSRDIVRVLAKMIQRGAPKQSNRVRSYLHAAFNAGLRHDNDPATLNSEVMFHLEANPVSVVPRQPGDGSVVDRNLSADELKRFLHDIRGPGFSEGTRQLVLLILYSGGQRAYEIINTEWDNIDIDAGDWIIPPSLAKNKRLHAIPLTSQMKDILRNLKLLAGDSPYVYPSSRDPLRPGRTDSLAQSFSRYCQRENMVRFTPRDLRTTCKTLMTKFQMGSKEVLDRIQHHALNDVSTKHYNMHDYRSEKLESLQRWNDWLTTINES